MNSSSQVLKKIDNNNLLSSGWKIGDGRFSYSSGGRLVSAAVCQYVNPVTGRMRSFLHLVLGLLLMHFAGCGKKEQQHVPIHPVEVVAAHAKTVSRYIDSIGSCVSPAKVLVIPQVSGQIVKIHFIQGQDVKAGDLLYTIDPRPYQAELERAIGQLKQDEAQLELNRLLLKRSVPLASGMYVSPQDLDKYRIQVDMMEAALEADHAAVEAAQINLGYCFIASPIDGKTGAYLVNEGNVVQANDPKGLVSIQTIAPIYAEFIVSDSEMIRIRSQMQKTKILAEIASMEDAALRETGDLFFIDNEVKQKSGTVTLRAICPNKDKSFWPGQFINVRVLLEEVPDAVLGPYSAVQIGENGPYVFVIGSDSKAELRPVKLGQRYGDEILFETGVKSGEHLVTEGHLMLRPGSVVRVVSRSKKD